MTPSSITTTIRLPVERKRLPDVFEALVDGTAFVNARYSQSLPPLLLLFVSSE